MMTLKEIQFYLGRLLEKKVAIFAIIFLVMSYLNYQEKIELRKTINVLLANDAKKANSFMGLTDNGIPVEIPRNFISPENREYEIAEALSKLLIDRASITNDFKISKFKNPTDIIDNSYNLQLFLKEYVQIHRNQTSDLLSLQARGLNALSAYCSYIATDMMPNNKLPHFLRVKGVKEIPEEQFIVEDNAFEIVVYYDTSINTYDGKDANGNAIWKPSVGVSKIKARGFFDIKTTTSKDAKKKTVGLNKSGLHFISWTVEYSLGK